MSVTDYECALCGKLANRGSEFIVTNIKPNEHQLELWCPDKRHHSWITSVEVKCPDCGKVPAYQKLWASEREPVPFLTCCEKTWVPKDHGPNPFAEEVAI